MRPSRQLVLWGCRRGRCGPIWCGVAGSGPDPRRRSPGRLSFAEREEISRGLAGGRSLRAIAAGLGPAPTTVSRVVAARGGSYRYRAASADQIAVVALEASQGLQAGDQHSPGWCGGGEAGTAVVAPADRRLVEDHLTPTINTCSLPREHLPHPVHPVARCAPQGTPSASADRASDPTSSRNPAARWPWWPAGDPAHLRTTRRSRRPGGACALGR